MLVLSRQRDESIMIGDDIEITIVDVKGDKVRLGIVSPKNTPVHRREIYDAIQREKAQKITETSEKLYLRCGGAYQSKRLEKDVYLISSQFGKRLDCVCLDNSGYCCLTPTPNPPKKCPLGIEKLV